MADYFRSLMIHTISPTAGVTKESIADSSFSDICIYLPPSTISSSSFGSFLGGSTNFCEEALSQLQIIK